MSVMKIMELQRASKDRIGRVNKNGVKLYPHEDSTALRLAQFGFVGIPLSSQNKTGSWYLKFDFKGKTQIAVLSQIRVLSVSRLSSRMGELDALDMNRIKQALFIFLK